MSGSAADGTTTLFGRATLHDFAAVATCESLAADHTRRRRGCDSEIHGGNDARMTRGIVVASTSISQVANGSPKVNDLIGSLWRSTWGRIDAAVCEVRGSLKKPLAHPPVDLLAKSCGIAVEIPLLWLRERIHSRDIHPTVHHLRHDVPSALKPGDFRGYSVHVPQQRRICVRVLSPLTQLVFAPIALATKREYLPTSERPRTNEPWRDLEVVPSTKGSRLDCPT